MKLVLFDFDGTLTTADSMLEFSKLLNGTGRHNWYIFRTLPGYVLYKLGLAQSELPKNQFLRRAFGGKPHAELLEEAKNFHIILMSKYLNSEAIKCFEDHIIARDKVVIVTGGCELWIDLFAQAYRVDVIASKLAYADGICLGKLDGPNNIGAEKVNRIKLRYQLTDYSEIIAYGDTRNDEDMLALADVGHYRKFQKKSRLSKRKTA